MKEPVRGWLAEYTAAEMADWPQGWLRERLLRLTMEYGGASRDEAQLILRRVGERITS